MHAGIGGVYTSDPRTKIFKIKTNIKYPLRFHKNKIFYLSILGEGFLTVSTIVMNRSYHKRIFIRVSCDGWKSFVDYPAQHVVHMPEENIDLFTVKHQLSELTKLDGDITNVHPGTEPRSSCR